MEKLMNYNEIVQFIKNMPFNIAYAAIAEGWEDNGNVSGIEAYGWWSIIKLRYADTESLVFDYFGGGSPRIYCIDGSNGEDTIEIAVEHFLINDCSGKNERYIVDTKLENIVKDTYLDAVDTVCMDCDYCTEKYCEDCPVRKTVNAMRNVI